MPLEIRARLSDARVAVDAAESQRLLFIEVSAPVPEGATLPLNLGLVLDKSGSMEGVAIACLKEAAHHIVDRLTARDHIAVVAFNDEPEVLVPNQPVTDPARLKLAIDGIVAAGGTAIDAGMEIGLREVRKTHAPAFLAGFRPSGPSTSVNRLFVLTDGHNQHGDDERCVILARQAVKEQIAFSTFGIGETFSVQVLRDVANAGNGMLHHVAGPSQIAEAFRKELHSIQRIGATNVRLDVVLPEGVELGAKDPACMVSPAVVIQEVERRTGGFSINLGDMPSDSPIVLLITVYVPNRPAGRHDVAYVAGSYDDVAGTGHRAAAVPASAEWVERYVQEVDPEIQLAISRVAIYKQRQKAIAVAASNPDLARTMLQSATELASHAGNDDLATILQATLTELKRDGRISDRTMIQGEVSSRTVLE